MLRGAIAISQVLDCNSRLAGDVFAQTIAVEAEREPTLCMGLDRLDDADIDVDIEVGPDAEPVLPCLEGICPV